MGMTLKRSSKAGVRLRAKSMFKFEVQSSKFKVQEERGSRCCCPDLHAQASKAVNIAGVTYCPLRNDVAHVALWVEQERRFRFPNLGKSTPRHRRVRNLIHAFNMIGIEGPRAVLQVCRHSPELPICAQPPSRWDENDDSGQHSYLRCYGRRVVRPADFGYDQKEYHGAKNDK
jgi:hypothetical protein